MRATDMIATVGLLLMGAACTEWHVESVSPQQLIATHPSELRVTLAAGDQLVIPNPSLIGDTLVGIAGDATSRVRYAVPLSRVQETATRRVNEVETGLLVVGVVAVTAVVVVIKTYHVKNLGCLVCPGE